MVNQAEDLIRETFQKLGDTLGIQIDIPDETIANLAATLQADIDRIEAVDTERFSFLNELGVAFRRGEKNARPSQLPVLEGIRAVLAHLHYAGRLLAADETPFTAEQVEDVRTMLWSPGVTALEAFRRLRALFPATEPAEEETRAELCAVRLCVLPARHSGVHADREGLRWNNPTSSPVVPAPSETGPWQTWEAVPDDVWFTSASAVGSLPAHRKRGSLVDWQFRDGSVGMYDVSQTWNGKLMARAPFVAVEEGKA